MAIQNRRGVYSDFTPSKMVPGELAVVQSGDPNNTSGKAVYAAFGSSGDVKRLATEDDLSKKVDKVTGKGLSTNDYTTAEKNKLNGIEAQANKTVIDATLTQTGKAADAKAVGDAFGSINSNVFSIIGFDNLVEWDAVSDGKYIDVNGQVGDLGQSHYSVFLPVVPGTYAYSFEQDTPQNKTHRIHGYDSEKVWLGQIISMATKVGTTITFTVTDDIKYIRISSTTMATNPHLTKSQSIIADLDERSLAYRGQLTFADDMHDLRYPGMYYVNGGSDRTNIPENFPSVTDRSVRVVVIKSSSNTHDSEAHIVISSDNIWYEKYINSSSGWSSWHKIQTDADITELYNQSLAYRGQLTSADDMHDLPYPGMYYINSNNGIPENFPYSFTGHARVLVNKSATPTNHAGETHYVMGQTSLWVERCMAGSVWTQWIKLTSYVDPTDNYIPLGLHVVPENQGVTNVIRRARQLADIKWKAAAQFKRGFYETGDSYLGSHGAKYYGTFEANTEYEGIPYSEVNYTGIRVPIDCFATAVCNVNSAQIIESQSTSEGTNKASYYGTNCVGFVSYALDIPLVSSSVYDQIRYFTNLGKVNDNGVLFPLENIKLCDVLHISSHVAIVTDILKDYNGNIYAIEISESTRQGNPNRDVTGGQYGGKCRRVVMTTEEFYLWFDGFSILRFQNLDKVEYEPNRYSPMVDEGKPLSYTDFPCMPYEGNMASYPILGSRLIKLLINSHNYTHIRIYKEDILFDEQNINDATYIEVQCDNEEAEYTACLVRYDGDTAVTSISCHWYIRPLMTTSRVVIDNKLVITFKNIKPNRFKPWFAVLRTASGDVSENAKFYRVYEDNITTTVNQDNTVNYSFEIPYTDSTYTRVLTGLRYPKYGAGQDTYSIPV